MRSILIDELRPADIEKVRGHLKAACTASRLPDVYWLELPPDLLGEVQREHAGCGPHRVALVLEEGSVRLELLVRARESLRCACTGYASQAQRRFCLGFMDRMIEELGLET